MQFYAYILRCRDGSYYSGYTTDLSRRISVHNAKKGSKYTRSRTPVTLAYCESFATKSEAMRREAAFKQLTHAQKQQLAATFESSQRAREHP